MSRGDEDDLYMMVKDNDCERNECVSACLRKRRIEKDEIVVYTIFSERNNILYIFKCSIYVRLSYYVRHISILLLENVIICHVLKYDSFLLYHFVYLIVIWNSFFLGLDKFYYLKHLFTILLRLYRIENMQPPNQVNVFSSV